jgi:site-specific recombinase XerD
MHLEDFLSLEEWHTLMKATQSAREAALLWRLGGAGLRVSEAATLKVEHLDNAGGYLDIVKGKGGKQRTSILPMPVLEALQGHLGGRDVGYILRGARISCTVASCGGRTFWTFD